MFSDTEEKACWPIAMKELKIRANDEKRGGSERARVRRARRDKTALRVTAPAHESALPSHSMCAAGCIEASRTGAP